MSLSECRTRQRVRILSTGTAGEEALRMHEMGLRLGTVVHVTHRGAFGSMVIAIGGARLALDGRTARAVGVEPLAG